MEAKTISLRLEAGKVGQVAASYMEHKELLLSKLTNYNETECGAIKYELVSTSTALKL